MDVFGAVAALAAIGTDGVQIARKLFLPVPQGVDFDACDLGGAPMPTV